MTDSLTEHFRCPERYVRIADNGPVAGKPGYFFFGDDITCYGKLHSAQPSEHSHGMLHDAFSDVQIRNGTAYLPFDSSEVSNNLRGEFYESSLRQSRLSAFADLYYFLRPILPVRLRRQIQKFHLRDWDKLYFPRWPVDCSVDALLEKLLLLSIRASGVKEIPFVWFWPNRASSCAIMTHDVETRVGQKFCPKLMDIDDSHEIKASFQIVPESRYPVTEDFLDLIRDRGFEVVVHDLNHDGRLYENHEQFLERAIRINAYGKQYGAIGFRAGVLYRKQLWFDALDFAYDMSVPNVARLDPQRGGCCSVTPYFMGKILEIPVTTTQDYTLFNILRDYSIDLWKQQTSIIMQKHGLMSFIAHPDYIVQPRERTVYERLLEYLVRLRSEKAVWITTPGEVNRWWRQRAEMRLVEGRLGWEIEGPGKERAHVAYASEREGRLALNLRAASPTDSTVLDSPICMPSQTRQN